MKAQISMMGLVVLGFFCAGCGGDAELGEECGEEGVSEGECEEGSICGTPGDSEVLECLKVCDEQTDCPSDQDCNGVSGTDIKGCRPKDDKKK